MDFGNAQTTGQVFIGTVRNKIRQPASKEFMPVPEMNVITEEVNYSTIEEKDSGASCSLAEALERQDLYINSILAQVGCDILWKMFKEGRILYRGAYINLDTLRLIRYRYRPCETDSFPCRSYSCRKGSICNFLPIRIKPEPDSGFNPH